MATILLSVLLAVACIVAGFLSRNWWLPKLSPVLPAARHGSHATHGSQDAASHKHGEADAHAGHDHAAHPGCDHAVHAAHDEATSLRLSEQAQKNIGLRLVTVEPGGFDRTISVPATVVERPGRTRIRVSAPMNGIVTRIYPIRGVAVTPGQQLFDLRMTHEDVVEAQSGFLRTVEQLDVIKREVARLEQVTASGAVAGKTLLERQYEQQKTEAVLHAQQQSLVLHGLTQEQVEQIASDRKLLQNVTMFAPRPAEEPNNGTGEHLLQVSEVEVEQGQHVTTGDPLCVLTDHTELYVEGKAFEEDAQELNEAAKLGAPITAIIQGNGKGPHSVGNLRILYVENEVELRSRALRFYVRLPNQLTRNEAVAANEHRFIGWRYRPGQRVDLRIPVERWEDRVVLPVEAVVNEGVESFVFQQNGDYFGRRPVHVEYRDQRWAVIANDGTLSPGDVVAAAGAYQMHLALKNKAGSGVDPHAGHQH